MASVTVSTVAYAGARATHRDAFGNHENSGSGSEYHSDTQREGGHIDDTSADGHEQPDRDELATNQFDVPVSGPGLRHRGRRTRHRVALPTRVEPLLTHP
jgi:hypothetical protein